MTTKRADDWEAVERHDERAQQSLAFVPLLAAPITGRRRPSHILCCAGTESSIRTSYAYPIFLKKELVFVAVVSGT